MVGAWNTAKATSRRARSRPLAGGAAILYVAVPATFQIAAAADEVPAWDAVEAVSIAQDADIYHYPLVVYKMMRLHPNVAVPDAEHAPIGTGHQDAELSSGRSDQGRGCLSQEQGT
jgi:hypothetical protein